jgi:hypothetical protein
MRSMQGRRELIDLPLLRGLRAVLPVPGRCLVVTSLLAAPTFAQSVAISDSPEAVSLTVYRAPNRGERRIDANWPQGYALITETRTVQIPAGESLIRFEGVAEGMFPESAIVTGLPKGVREKNRDARLLSPSGLVDAYLKRQVTLTRTDKATGKVREQSAMITAGPGGGVVLQTAEGFEALRCTGLPERMQYGGVPQNLSAKPTLSVITQSDAPITAQLTLTYMASGFDWQANYVAQAKPLDDGAVGKGKVDIFAWLTLANGGNQSFLNANTMAIAGEPNRERRAPQARPTGGALNLQCWPAQRTHEVPYNFGFIPPPPSPPPPPMAAYEAVGAEAIMVTASRQKMARAQMAPVAAVVAEQEDLGDLKLYRIPEPVSVNAKGQKQVAMIVKPGAAFERLYVANVDEFGDEDSFPMAILLRSENRKEKGLGLPMPSGQVMVFEDSDYGPLLAGQSSLMDRAVGDDIEMRVGTSSDVRYRRTLVSQIGDKQKYKVEISNARSEAINVEIEIPYELRGSHKHIPKVDGVPTWKATVPANGDATLYYELKLES